MHDSSSVQTVTKYQYNRFYFQVTASSIPSRRNGKQPSRVNARNSVSNTLGNAGCPRCDRATEQDELSAFSFFSSFFFSRSLLARSLGRIVYLVAGRFLPAFSCSSRETLAREPEQSLEIDRSVKYSSPSFSVCANNRVRLCTDGIDPTTVVRCSVRRR